MGLSEKHLPSRSPTPTPFLESSTQYFESVIATAQYLGAWPQTISAETPVCCYLLPELKLNNLYPRQMPSGQRHSETQGMGVIGPVCMFPLLYVNIAFTIKMRDIFLVTNGSSVPHVLHPYLTMPSPLLPVCRSKSILFKFGKKSDPCEN